MENQSAYVVFRLGTQSAATSEHVTFDESSFPNRKESVVDLDVGDSSDLAGMNSSSSAASDSPSQQSVKLPSFPRIDLSNVSDGDILRPLSQRVKI